jgi:hypothetical protein
VTTTAGQKTEKKVTIKTLIDPLPGEALCSNGVEMVKVYWSTLQFFKEKNLDR